MPRKSSARQPKPEVVVPPYYTDNETPWGGYCNLNLTDDHKLVFASWLEMNEDYLPAMLADVVGEGVQLSLKYQHEQQGYTCTLTAKPRPDMVMRCCLTSWGNSPTEALNITLFKWIQLLGKDMSDYRPKTHAFARWG